VAMSTGPGASHIAQQLAWGQAAANDEPTEAVIPGRGTRIDRFVVISQLAQGKHATVVQARLEGGSFVALKLATTRTGAELVDREARLLQTLNAGADAGPPPCFHGAGATAGRRYCARGWVSGVEVRVAAAKLRAPGSFIPTPPDGTSPWMALAIVTGPDGARPRSPARPVIPRVEPQLTAVLEAFRRGAFRQGATASLAAPTCSVNSGAAGVAFALARLGKITGDAAALDRLCAEIWRYLPERLPYYGIAHGGRYRVRDHDVDTDPP
jgi:hypothetical protein